jgi:phospholipid/cholesterol/gamma-HCH transport system substrate-binding protein
MTDYNSIQRKRNIIVGGFVIIAAVAMLWMVAVFGELPVAATKLRSFPVVVDFPSSSGIQGKTPVYYCGYQIGKVTAVQAPHRNLEDKHHHVRVSIAIDKDFKTIPMNVEFKVMKRSMGSSFVELVDPEFPLTTDNEDPFLRDGLSTTFKGGLGSTNEFIPEKVQKKLETLVVKISTLAASIDQIVGDEQNQQNIRETLANFTSVTEEASATLKSVSLFTESSRDVISETSESLNRTLKQINMIMNSVNDGEGTVSRLLNDGRLYENLLDSSQELSLALEQLKELAAEAREKGIKIKW